MFHFMVKPRPLRYIGLETPGNDVDSSAIVTAPGTRCACSLKRSQKIDRLQILVTTVNSWAPLAWLAGIVEVQHGSHRVHAQAVDMVFLQPEQCV